MSGISARISFTNNLIDSTDIQGSDPILTGASGRLWLSPSAPSRCGSSSRATTAMPRWWSGTARSRSTTRCRTSSTRARCPPRTRRPEKGRHRADPDGGADPEPAGPADAAAQRGRADAPQRRRAAGLQGRGLAQAVGRADRRRPARLGRDARRSARDRDLFAWLEHPGARAEGHRHLVRTGPAERLQRSARPRGRRWSGSPRRRRAANAAGRTRRGEGASATPRSSGAAAVQAHLPFTLAAPEQARRPPAPVGASCSTGAARPRRS